MLELRKIILLKKRGKESEILNLLASASVFPFWKKKKKSCGDSQWNLNSIAKVQAELGLSKD